MIRPLKFIVLITFIFPIFNIPVYAGQRLNSSPACQEVGIIVQSQDPALRGKLCEGDRLKVESRVLISCRFKPLLNWLEAGEHDINRRCPSERTDTRCLKERSCYRTSSRIELIGNTFASLDLIPTLKWHPVENAQGYEILIRSSSGDDVRRALISEPEYSFSEPLNYGELYELEIFALESPYSGRFAFYIPSQQTIKELNSSLSAVQNSDLFLVDKAVYTDSIYMSVGLLSETIELLEKSPALDQATELEALLGDRYLEAGYFDKARAIYEKISRTAPEESQERLKALEFLEIQSQLPSNTKLPQL